MVILVLFTSFCFGAGIDVGNAQKSDINIIAIVLFLLFVLATLGITYFSTKRSQSAQGFYTAGGNITGWQNGITIAGDYMSAASFLGIVALVFANGFDGLIYSIGFLVGWSIVLFLIAEKFRNLGKYTFADIVAYRLRARPIRTIAAISGLAVIVFYLIAQMVGAGQLIQVLFGLPYTTAVIVVGILMICYVVFGGMHATTWVQIIKACCYLVALHLWHLWCFITQISTLLHILLPRLKSQKWRSHYEARDICG